MSHHAYRASLELETLVRAIVETVPGVTLAQVERTVEVTGAGHHRPGFDIRVSGWSPTFHERSRRWLVDTCDSPDGPDGPFTELKGAAMAERVWTQLRDRLDAHAEHAAAARRAGIDRPLALPDLAAGHHAVGHLHVTVAALDLLIQGMGAASALDSIAASCADLVRQDGTERLLMNPDGDLATVVGDLPVYQPMVLLSGRRVTIRGGVVTVTDRIPSTILDALPGRPLRALVETGVDHLDDTAIDRIEVNAVTGGTSAWLTLPTMRIADHPAYVGDTSCPRAPRKDEPE